MPVNLATANRNDTPEANAALADALEEIAIGLESLGATAGANAASRTIGGRRAEQAGTKVRLALKRFRQLAVTPEDA